MPITFGAKPGLSQEPFAKLMQFNRDDLRATMRDLPFVSNGISMARLNGSGIRYSFSEALAIEAARQFADDGGISLENALRITGPNIAQYFQPRERHVGKTLADFWIGVARARNTWGSAPRGSYPVTSFGAGEYWSGVHFFGSLHRVMAEIIHWQQHDEYEHPESDPATIFLSNISAADRRLRKRAADLGIKIEDNEFA